MVVLTEKKEDPTHTEVPPARNDSNSEQAPAPYRLAPTGTDLEDKSTPIAFGANGRTIAWGAADGSLNAWDLASGKLEATLKGANGPVHSVAFTADSRQVVSSYANGVVLQWDLKSGTAIDIKAQPGEPKSVVISPRGDRIVSFSGGTVELGSAETGKTLAATMLLRPGGETIRSVAFSPDGSRVVAAYSGGLMFVDAQSFRKTAEVHVGDDPITSVAFSPDDRQIAVGTATGPIVLLDAANQRQLRTIKGNGEPVASLAFMPNNDSLVWTSSTGSFSFVKLDGDVPR